MAPYVLDNSPSPWVSSSYTPSMASIDALKKQLRLAHQQNQLVSAAWDINSPQPIDSHDRAEEVGDWVIQLSLKELQEIEDAVVHFESQSPAGSRRACLVLITNPETGLPLNRIQAETFPLPTLGKKLRERSMLLHNDKTFFMLRGLKPQWFSKHKNVVLYLGIASHVATKRACAKGDATVLRESTATQSNHAPLTSLLPSSDHVTNMQAPDGDEEKTYRGPGNRDIAIVTSIPLISHT